MKKLYIYSLALFGILLSYESIAQKQKFSYNETYQVSNSPTLSISSQDGDIDIYPSDKNVIEVFYIVKQNNEVLDITSSQLEDDFIIEISSGVDYLNISVKQRYEYRMMDWSDRKKISFEIYTPFKTSCDLLCSDGDIKLLGLSADQKLRSSDGDISVDKVKGSVYAKTSDGDLLVREIVGNVEPLTSDGDVKLVNITGDVDGRTSDGDVDIQGVKGLVSMVTSDGDINAEAIVGDLKLTSSDGDIRLTQSRGAMILSTSDGNISFRDLAGSLKARTSDGQVKGNMISLDGDLELRTSDGNIEVEVPADLGLNLLLRGESIRTTLRGFSGVSKDHVVDGEINGGGILINLHASDGYVTLTYE
ncbi:DUF4097 domain-containing protein [Reichenbachiella carrageenanivorans]|uniref:DUF4097 domain-containing protein n=1 Tax=Reichenbachiella carrageenanivorans TaxID=2979869 RepID=A0ABY6CW59_9BACT|nr:DUF4097 domain-containing protein [Reichenbachiella carrageenanivorans]UXX77640.1 DUF4097 domain-containing protein [Reichenbachiella carrageenanivorans]